MRPMPTLPQRPWLWDIFCTVVDNHGDLGVCWRLTQQLAQAGHHVRLWVDQPQALGWMAPQAHELAPRVRILPWPTPGSLNTLLTPTELPAADVWVEAFGCTLPDCFVRRGVHQRQQSSLPPPVWINLEYLSAEPWVARMHGLPSPVTQGAAHGWTKWFFYPGFVPGTGGLLREDDATVEASWATRQQWRADHQDNRQGLHISLFCYEPPGLAAALSALVARPHCLWVTPGRAWAATEQARRQLPTGAAQALVTHALPYTSQSHFDAMLRACDLNLVRGEDSLVRALWANTPFVWQIYPQDDNAHHDKLTAFLDWLQAPASLRRFHEVWNGLRPGPCEWPNATQWQEWQATAQNARAQLRRQPCLLRQLTEFVAQKAVKS